MNYPLPLKIGYHDVWGSRRWNLYHRHRLLLLLLLHHLLRHHYQLLLEIQLAPNNSPWLCPSIPRIPSNPSTLPIHKAFHWVPPWVVASPIPSRCRWDVQLLIWLRICMAPTTADPLPCHADWDANWRAREKGLLTRHRIHRECYSIWFPWWPPCKCTQRTWILITKIFNKVFYIG